MNNIKAYDVAVFLFFMVFSVNIISASNIFGSDVSIYYGSWATKMTSDIQGTGVAPQNDEALSYSELAISSFGLLVRSLIAIILVFSYSTFLLPLFLWQLGLPADVTAPITFGVWLTYVIGYAQYRARSTLLGTE